MLVAGVSARISGELRISRSASRMYHFPQERSVFFSTWPPQHGHHTPSVGALHAQDLFQEGDRVRCLVTFVDEGSHKISLSTSDLEEVDGDMILNQVQAAARLTIAERRSPCGHPSIWLCGSLRSASASHFGTLSPSAPALAYHGCHVSPCCCSAMTGVLLHAGEGPCSCR